VKTKSALVWGVVVVTLTACAGCVRAENVATRPLEPIRLREICATAAERYWRRSGNEATAAKRRDGESPDAPTLTYTSRYDRELDRCLVIVSDWTAHTDNVSITIFDASEGLFVAKLVQTFPTEGVPFPRWDYEWTTLIPPDKQNEAAFIALAGILTKSGGPVDVVGDFPFIVTPQVPVPD
jgi:hypothetical protein